MPPATKPKHRVNPSPIPQTRRHSKAFPYSPLSSKHKFWQGLKDSPIQRKLFIALGITAVLSSVGLVISVLIIDQTLRTQLLDQAQSELSVMAINYDTKINQMKLGFKGQSLNAAIADTALRQSPNLAIRNILLNAIWTGEFEIATLTNTSGLIINGANLNRYGTKLDPNGLVTQALTSGEQVASTEVISYDDLALESPRFAELRAAELGLGSEDKPEFLIRYTVTPVRRPNSQIVGALISGDVVKSAIPVLTNNTLGGGFSAIFLKNTLVAGTTSGQTQLPNAIKLSNDATAMVQQALKAKSTVKQEAVINNKTYAIAATAILSSSGKPVGVLMRGISKDAVSGLVNSTTGLVLTVSMLALLVGLIVARLIGRTVTEPIQNLEQAANKFAKGDLNSRADVTSKDEIGVLADVFNQLAKNLQQREAEQNATKLELETQSFYLQEEVGHLLEIVSEVESGNLTVQAIVSDQATGLISDTLNRLIEQLSSVLAKVLSTSRQVSYGAESLEILAINVASNAQQQAQLVTQARSGIENVNQLAQGASDQSVKADAALKSVQTAVRQGQEQVLNLTSSIAQLQQGSIQMVQRIKTLGEFVDLAKQFVQDQKRLASLTQVLAMNASMIAARAVEQKEPDQFASVAREFEAIAAQVNNLATQTSQGLVVLQQRTGFIEIVVSGIDQDVRDVSGLVTELTNSVEQSSSSLENIRTVAEEVALVGQTVTQTSQAIATAVEGSFAAIKDIATVAERSASQALVTREQSGSMGELARRLLEDIQFFRLPVAKIKTIDTNSQPVPELISGADLEPGSNGYKHDAAEVLSQ
jgi:methyl-accepting chemotaxis protein PixJ